MSGESSGRPEAPPSERGSAGVVRRHWCRSPRCSPDLRPGLPGMPACRCTGCLDDEPHVRGVEVRHVELPQDQVRCHGPRRVAGERVDPGSIHLAEPGVGRAVAAPWLLHAQISNARSGANRPLFGPIVGADLDVADADASLPPRSTVGCLAVDRESAPGDPGVRRQEVVRIRGPLVPSVSSMRLPRSPRLRGRTVAPEVIEAQLVGNSISTVRLLFCACASGPTGDRGRSEHARIRAHARSTRTCRRELGRVVEVDRSRGRRDSCRQSVRHGSRSDRRRSWR